MKCIQVALGSRGYSVLIEYGLLERAGELLTAYAPNGRIVVVSDEKVWRSAGRRLRDALHRSAIETQLILVAPGEATKSWRGIAELTDRLLALELTRGEYIVGFGGGVVGDLAGFAAAIFKRGCGYIQIPTTLLAQVDSSVGGKTGINSTRGKNLIGVIHQPSLVLIDPSLNESLPPRQRRAGYAEIVKYGLIADADFFRWCEEHAAALLAGEPDVLLEAIARSVAYKSALVEKDERDDLGQRALLNLGHTFGHALEAASGFSERMLHGEAVAIGMNLAFAFSVERGFCPEADATRVQSHIEAVGLPTGFSTDPKLVLHHLRQDKKASTKRLSFILARGIGRAFLAQDVQLADVEAFLLRQQQ